MGNVTNIGIPFWRVGDRDSAVGESDHESDIRVAPQLPKTAQKNLNTTFRFL